MIKLWLVLVIGFAAAFGAGVVVGVRRPVETPATPETPKPEERQRRGPGYLEKELKLTPEQKEQMRQIWEDLGRRDGPSDQLRHERDEKIASLIPPEDKPKYEQILQDYQRKMREMEEARRVAFREAVEKTRKILNEEQRQKYDKLHEEMVRQDRGGRPDRGRRGPGRGGEERATTRPAQP